MPLLKLLLLPSTSPAPHGRLLYSLTFPLPTCECPMWSMEKSIRVGTNFLCVCGSQCFYGLILCHTYLLAVVTNFSWVLLTSMYNAHHLPQMICLCPISPWKISFFISFRIISCPATLALWQHQEKLYFHNYSAFSFSKGENSFFFFFLAFYILHRSQLFVSLVF